jgi:galactokinase
MGRDSIGLMEFNGSHCALHRLSSPVPIHFVVADLKASKDTVVILRELNACFPHPSSPTEVCSIFFCRYPPHCSQHAMHQYVHTNQDLAWKAVLAICSGDLNSLAEAMAESQRLFNACAVQNCPSELTAPLLNRTINDPSLRPLHLAAKGIGSQGDGSIQFLCNSSEQQTQLLSVLSSDLWNYDAFALTIAASSPSAEPHQSLTRQRSVFLYLYSLYRDSAR